MNNKIIFGIGGIIVGLILATIFTSSSMFSGFRNGSVGMMGSTDKYFIEQMIPHHDGAVAMAKLALEKSKRPEVKTLAEAIIVGQIKEIQDMRNWYKEWFGTNVPEGSAAMMGGGMMSGSGMHMGGEEDMTTLLAAVDFDKAFLEAMIPHHQLALMMVQMLKAGTNRPEMIQLGENIIVSQSKEIQEMQGWYEKWYK